MHNSKIILHHQFITAISVQEFCLANQLLHSLASNVYIGYMSVDTVYECVHTSLNPYLSVKNSLGVTTLCVLGMHLGIVLVPRSLLFV